MMIEEAIELLNAELNAQRAIMAALCDWCADAGVIDMPLFISTLRDAKWREDDKQSPIQMKAILDYLETRGKAARPVFSVIDGGKDTETP